MSDNLATGVVSIALGILGVATLAVIVSTKSNTTGVIQASASGVSNSILAATSTITGASITANVSYPSSSSSV